MPVRRKSGKRSRAGCIACRLGRKKCDESKPNCSLCIKRKTKCIWPDTPSTLSGYLNKNKDVQLEVTMTKKITRTRAGCLQCKKDRKKCDQTKPICIRCEKKNVVCEWPDLFDVPKKEYNTAEENCIDIIELSKPATQQMDIVSNIMNNLTFCNKMSNVGLINNFFNAVINLLIYNSSIEFMSDIAFDSLKTSVEFQKIITSFSKSALTRKTISNDDESINDTNSSLSVILNLENSESVLELKLNALIYSILKILFNKNNRSAILLYVKIALNLILKHAPKNPSLRLQTLMESIMYNFAASYIVRSDKDIDPMNPFVICDGLRYLFSAKPTIDSNPLLGESFDPFIIVAKVSYLFKKNKTSEKTFDSLMQEIDFYLTTHPACMITIHPTPMVGNLTSMPIFLTKYIVLLASKLLLLHLNGERESDKFNAIIDELLIILESSKAYRSEMIKYGYWGVFMLGLNLRTKEHQKFLIDYFHNIYDENNDLYYLKGCDSLEHAWKEDIGFEILREESFLKNLCLN